VRVSNTEVAAQTGRKFLLETVDFRADANIGLIYDQNFLKSAAQTGRKVFSAVLHSVRETANIEF